MQSVLSNQFDNLVILAITISVLGLTFSIIRSYSQYIDITRLSQMDPSRIQEGLPTNVTLTPEDFRANPELAEIFEITDTNANLDVALESNQHFEAIQNQIAAGTYDNLLALYDVVVAYLSSFF
jgi:hypothetical protein